MTTTSGHPNAPPGATATVRRRLRVNWHGRLAYGAALELQEATHAARLAGRCPNTLLLLEHPPVVTLGSSSERARDAVSRSALRARGISVQQTARGGRATFHGPGQLVGYPILDLRDYGADAHAYVRALEEALIASAGDFGVAARTRPGLTGVWVQERKLASIGIQIRRWVTLHGFALNVDMDLTPFQLFDPCGLPDLRVTTLALEAGRPVALSAVRLVAARHIGEALNRLPSAADG